MENNQAFIGKLGYLRPIEGADKIIKASVFLKNILITEVIVSADTEEGQEVVYFDSNLCLVKTTILADYPELERYLGRNGRIKTIKLRGEYSDGLCLELSKFYHYFKNVKEAKAWLEQGKSFNEIGDKKICFKYEPPVKGVSRGGNKEKKGKKPSRLIEGQFHFHIDTQQLTRNMDEVNPDDTISISRKVHGTSSIISNCLVKRPLNIFEKILKNCGVKIIDTKYDILYSSRRVVKNDAIDTGYYETDIWSEAGKTFAPRLQKGETAYFEILGYLPSNAWIQKNYDYGNIPGQYSIQLYRMTMTNLEGVVVEYPWPLLKEKAKYLNIPFVKEYYYGTAKCLFPEIEVNETWHENFLSQLRETYLEKFVEENLTKKVPDEGIVLRVEAPVIQVYKLKSLNFLQHETKMYEETAANVEDSEGA